MLIAQESLQDIKDYLLFLHSFSGCDTTSSTFNKGKLAWLKKLRSSLDLKYASTVLTDLDSSFKAVEDASIMAFKVIYGGDTKDSLSRLRLVLLNVYVKTTY